MVKALISIKKLKINSLLLVIVAVLIGTIITMLYLNQVKKTTVPDKAPEGKLVDLMHSQYIPFPSDIPQQETLKIQETINAFENFKYNKDFVGAFDQITPPQNTEEKSWFDHLLGNDLASLNDGKQSPRFLDKANFHIIAGYETESITKKNDIYYASVKEIRFVNSVKEDGDTPNYVLQTQDLTFELVDDQGVFQISKYYHTKPTSLVTLKYEGFVAY